MQQKCSLKSIIHYVINNLEFVIFFKRQKLMDDQPKRLIDTGAGFYLDEDDLEAEKKKETEITEEPRN
jgi:hypothetical protein